MGRLQPSKAATALFVRVGVSRCQIRGSRVVRCRRADAGHRLCAPSVARCRSLSDRASPVRRQCRALPQLGCRASDGSRQRRALPQFARPHVACAPPVSCGATVGVSRVSCAPPASRATATARDTRRCSDGPRTEHRGAVGNMRMFAPDELWITVPSVHMVRSGGAPPREQSNVGAHRIFRKE